jgi:hypothetical protein
MNRAQSYICSCICFFSVCLLVMVLQSGESGGDVSSFACNQFGLPSLQSVATWICSHQVSVGAMLVVSPAILLQSIAWKQRVTKRSLYKTEADSFVRWSIFSLSDEHFHYLIYIFIIFDLTSKKFSSSLFVSQFWVSYFVNRTEEILIHAPVHTEQEEITMKSAKFTKCTNGQKNSGPHPVRFELGGESWTVWCPSTFRTRFPYYHNTLNQVICIYLLEIFCFCFALADIIYFQHSRFGKIHGKWYDRIGPIGIEIF